MVGNIFNKKHIALSLVLITTLAVFYPVLSARLINLDDTKLIHDLNDTEKIHSLKNLFFRSSINRYYGLKWGQVCS